MDKIENRYKYIWCDADRQKLEKPVLLISHGSGGISSVEWKFAQLACDAGWGVCVLDHFTHRGVKSHWWHSIETYPSMQDRSQDLIDMRKGFIKKFDAMLGVSAGGTATIMAQETIKIPVFAVYPCLNPVTKSMLRSSDVTIHTGKKDDWTTVKHARRFAEITNADLHEHSGYHAYLKPGEDRYIKETISFRNLQLPIPFPDDMLLLNNYPLEKGVTLKYNKKSTDETYKHFIEWLNKIAKQPRQGFISAIRHEKK